MLRQRTGRLLGGLVLMTALVGCNLQGQPITPTLALSATSPVEITPLPSMTPAAPLIIPSTTLAATPTAIGLGTPVTPLLLSGTPAIGLVLPGTLVPTLDALQADQIYAVQARPGQVVKVKYEITMTRGRIRLTMQGATGVLWQRTFTSAENGTAEVPVPAGGAYEIIAEVDNIDGSYSLAWE